MANYYCSGKNGNDSNNGTTVALARKTVDSALSLLSAGDTLYIAPATYREQLTTGDFTAGSAEGSETKIIGDPDCNIFTGELPGLVRITSKDVNEKSQSSPAYTIQCAVNHIHFHNLYVEGPGATGTSTSANSTTDTGATIYVYATSDFNNQMWFDCTLIGGYYTFRGASSYSNTPKSPVLVRCALWTGGGYGTIYTNTIHSIAVGGRYGFAYGNHHGSITVGIVYGFYICTSNDNGTGGGTAYKGSANNCLAFCNGNYAFYRSSGCNNVAWGAGLYGFSDGAQNLKPNGLWVGGAFRGTQDGEEAHPHENIYYSQNYQNDYSSDGIVGNLGAGVLANPNMWNDLMKAIKPYDGFTTDYSNNVTSHGMQGWFSGSVHDFNPTSASVNAFGGTNSTANAIQTILTGSFDIEGNPYREANIRVLGPYTFVSSSLNQSTISGSNPSIQIGGLGSKIFQLPVSSSTNFTASVAVKYNSGVAPRFEITSSGAGFGYAGIKEDSITPQITSATGTGDQTGAFQILEVSSSVSRNDRVQLKLVQPHDDDSSFAIFAGLRVEE